jgi:hypothetical protein
MLLGGELGKLFGSTLGLELGMELVVGVPLRSRLGTTELGEVPLGTGLGSALR